MINYLEEYKKKAKELHFAKKLTMFSHSKHHVAFKVLGDERVHMRYVCPNCTHQEEIVAELKFPYKVKCSNCKFLVWESKLRKQRGRKKESGPVTI